MYTKIPHNKLIDVLCNIVDTTFNDTTRKFMTVPKTSARWVKGIRNTSFIYTADNVKACLKFLIENAFFRVGNLIFRQIIGIPMGSDPAPFFANLFLFFYECKYINTCKKHDRLRARRLFNIFRFIDDLLALNDGGEFWRCIVDIYPPELVLKKENISNDKATFLDLEIHVVNNEYLYKLYDKRNAFPFSIVRFPYRCSNMPSKMFYSTISAEILRICRASVQYDNFVTAADPFLKRMTRQGARLEGVRQSLKKLVGRHFNAFHKYGLQSEQLTNNLVNLL